MELAELDQASIVTGRLWSGEMDEMDGMDVDGAESAWGSFWAWGGNPVVSLVPSSTAGFRPAPLPGCDFVGGWTQGRPAWCRPTLG